MNTRISKRELSVQCFPNLVGHGTLDLWNNYDLWGMDALWNTVWEVLLKNSASQKL